MRSIVIADEYVDKDFGTGALKITPAHDPNDYTLGKKHQLPLINIMNKDATINALGTPRYAGLDRFECRKQLWTDMDKAGLVIKAEKHMQRVPRSQRGGEIIEPLVSAQWFVKMDSMAAKAVQAVRNEELHIIPERFNKMWFNWLENIHDWCISRQLWWGHRIPVYYIRRVDGRLVDSPDATSSQQPPLVVAKSMEEAQKKARALYPAAQSIELEQDEDVLDTWFRYAAGVASHVVLVVVLSVSDPLASSSCACTCPVCLQLGTVALCDRWLAEQRSPRLPTVLSRVGARNWLRHFVLLGRADGHHGHRVDGEGSVPHDIHARLGPRRARTEDVEDEGQRHRPDRYVGAVWRRCVALHPRDGFDTGTRRAAVTGACGEQSVRPRLSLSCIIN